MGKKKGKLTSYTIKLSEADKKAVGALIDGDIYTTRAQVLRALPGLYVQEQKQREEAEELISYLMDEVSDWRHYGREINGFLARCKGIEEGS